ncbi:formyltransferase family protein [Pelagibacteraceae bacterium]|nr:formyltransferase family protein [Pelagibacteraceae bacterium]
MKIGYFGDGPWSHEGINLISRNAELEIVFIIPRYDVQDPVLKRWAKKLGVDYIPLKDINSKDSITKIASYEADILVSMSFNQIIKKPLINLTKYKFINCHAGKLPFYRGCNVLNWVLINGEDKFGVTVHYIDEGIDTGDIIMQEVSPISENDDYASILKRATKLCSELLFKSLINIKNSSVKTIKQSSIDPKGSYCRRRIDGDEWIDWSLSSLEIYNFIRAISKPGPYARSKIDNKLILIHKAEILENTTEVYEVSPGVILSNIDGIVVKTGDSYIKIIRYSFESETNKNVDYLLPGNKFKS